MTMLRPLTPSFKVGNYIAEYMPDSAPLGKMAEEAKREGQFIFDAYVYIAVIPRRYSLFYCRAFVYVYAIFFRHDRYIAFSRNICDLLFD